MREIPISDMVLLHISPVANRDSIDRYGLTTGNPSSGYGDKPKHNAVYLYHSDNINIIYDMVNVFSEFDVYEVYNLDDKYAIPDEDSKCNDWRRSLDGFGCLAYTANIKADHIKRMCTVKIAK